jgi:carbonic anhydrase
MMNRLLLTGLMMVTTSALQAGTVHWGYTGDSGPRNWATLSPEFSDCTGKNQSPINLEGFVEAELPPVTFRYRKGSTEVINNGHTVQVNQAPGSSLETGGMTFELKQFHFHSPSENLIDGKSYPMEAHLVHADRKGNLAVVAVMFIEGEANPMLAEVWKRMPEKAGEQQGLPAGISAEGILPEDRGYYRFNGSLTTPPCSEGVRWLVMKNPVAASGEQIRAFAEIMHHPNNRPVQPVNARPVLK